MSDPAAVEFRFRPNFQRLRLTNFLSYREAEVRLDRFVAVVGPNASGKSNLVAALKLLREIPTHGLPTAIARRGGFDQLRHRSEGRPYDPTIRLEFRVRGGGASHYELRLGALRGKKYRVKSESALIELGGGRTYSLESDGRIATLRDGDEDEIQARVAPGQSAVSVAGGFASFVVYETLQAIQTVEVNPALVGELQDPSSTFEFESDGSNTTSILEKLQGAARAELVDQLSAIVPGIRGVEVHTFADKQTVKFVQHTPSGNREFFAKQMSDGTLRAFAILLALSQPAKPSLIVVEEPEIAIHLGALITLVDLLLDRSESNQVLITTHSADIVNAVPIESLRVVSTDGSSSSVAEIAEHTLDVLRKGLITPGQLLRSDALDPAVA